MIECVGVSVFKLSGITVGRVIAAVTARRRSPGNISYMTFREYVVLPKPTPGDTPDVGVNAQHYEFRDMSDAELVDLADYMMSSGGDIDSMDSNEIRKECRDSIALATWTPTMFCMI